MLGDAERIQLADPRRCVSEDGTRAVLHGLGLAAVPGWLAALPGLTHLDLSGNRLTVLPEWLAGLASLTAIDARGNELTALPSSLGELSSLTTLDLSRNMISVLPEWLGSLSSLKTLRVAGNRLTDTLGATFVPTFLSHLDVSIHPGERSVMVARI
jgi:Leucine-rich repeat (LRR) protein